MFHVCFKFLTKSVDNGFAATIRICDVQIDISMNIDISIRYSFLVDTQSGTDKLSYRANAQYSVCLHHLVCYRIDDIKK